MKEIHKIRNIDKVNIIGAGLAGCECAYILAKHGVHVDLYEMKPKYKSPAHHSNNFAELVCSNSLKSKELTNACGLLKEEMARLGSIMMEAAKCSEVIAGASFNVDRDKFSEYITQKIKSCSNITIHYEEVEDLQSLSGIVIIATGPLTSDKLSLSIAKLIGEQKLYFYDAAAPIILKESIDMDIAYYKDRWNEESLGDYLNLPMTEEEYNTFYNELIIARKASRHSFDTLDVKNFEGCMPIEDMASRGIKTLLYGPLKPVGLRKTPEDRPYAVVQLRPENEEKTMYNMVGFQTSLAFPEQKRIFSLIPGLKNAEFIRYGVMHKNTYINAPTLLGVGYKLKQEYVNAFSSNIQAVYFAGQISGVEGYVESAASGMTIAYKLLYDIDFPELTMLGALEHYIIKPNKDFQPMNANFGIVPELETKIRDKKEKYDFYAKRALDELTNIIETKLGGKII